jgi:integrase
MHIACPTTSQTQDWWNLMREKHATKLYVVADHGIYRLRAFTDDRKKCGELSLGLRNRKLAQQVANSLAIEVDDDAPAAIVNSYLNHKLMQVKACSQGKYAQTSLATSKEHSISTVKSRLNNHLLPFCRKRHITNIKDLYRCEIIGAYIDTLIVDEPIGDTARSIMASTLAMLRWYDRSKGHIFINNNFNDSIKGWPSTFGYRRKREKIFLKPNQIQAILRYEYPNDRIKAMFYLPLICGLRYNEFIHLRWRDLHTENGNMDVPFAKGGSDRKTQYPKVMQTFLDKVRKKRSTRNLPGDYIFEDYNKHRDLAIYKTFMKKILNIDGNDTASNGLRRSGCNLISKYQLGLADKQLGHSVCTKVTHKCYIDNEDFEDINYFWDTFYAICIKPDTVVGAESVRLMAMQPENVIDYFKLDTKAV